MSGGKNGNKTVDVVQSRFNALQNHFVYSSDMQGIFEFLETLESSALELDRFASVCFLLLICNGGQLEAQSGSWVSFWVFYAAKG